MQNWDQWTSDIDEISSENERNYENVVDRLFNYALQEPRTPTEIEQKTAYGGWRQLTSPTMQPPRQWSDAYTVATEMGEEAEDFIKKYTTDAITTFKDEVNQKYPDALLTTEQQAEKKKFIAVLPFFIDVRLSVKKKVEKPLSEYFLPTGAKV